MVYAVGGLVVVAPEDSWALDAQRLLRGHDGKITAFAMSPSGGLVATGCCGKNADVVLWDYATGEMRARFQEHDIEVALLTFSPDDRLLLSVGHEKDQKLFVLDSSTGKIVTRQPITYVPGKRMTAAAWAPVQGTSYSFALANCDGDVYLYSVEPFNGMAGCVKVTAGSLKRSFTSLVYSADGQWLYAGTATGDIVTINVLRRAMQMSHPACGGGVGAMCLTPSGRLLVGGGDGALTLFTNDHMWRDIRPFATVPGPITSLSMVADGSALVVGCSNGGIHRLPIGSTQPTTLVRAHTGPVRGVSTSSTEAATCSDDGSVCVWALGNVEAAGIQAPPYGQLQVVKAERHEAGAALCVAVAPQHGIVLSGWADGMVRCHTSGGPPAPAWVIPGAHVQPSATGVTALAVAQRAPFIVSGGAAGEVRCWDLRSRSMNGNMKMHSAPITDIVLLADEVHCIASSEDRSWSLWDIQQSTCRASWRIGSKLNGIAVCPDQVTVIAAGQDRSMTFYDIRSPTPGRCVPGAHDGEVTCIATSATGGLVATGGSEGAVKVWSTSTGALLATGACHTAAVCNVRFTAECEAANALRELTLVSVACDGTIAAWHMPWP
ncbi:hypothetical protein FOA52_007561 [Chlamydomonas sp. UWO 241]|nr:hypothetical protein FOA52_007561 [Chlamydomonas sp. UWO 241]